MENETKDKEKVETRGRKKKEKPPLNPIIEEKTSFIHAPNIPLQNFENVEILKSTNNNEDTYYKNVLNKLYDDTNVSTKTEYLNESENFVGAKIEFLSKYGNMPFLKEFLDIFEKKRISLRRQGRKEIIMALEQREKEQQQEKMNNLKSLFGV